MSGDTTTVWTCDWCRGTDRTFGSPAALPPTWRLVTLHDRWVVSLCRSCTAAAEHARPQIEAATHDAWLAVLRAQPQRGPEVALD